MNLKATNKQNTFKPIFFDLKITQNKKELGQLLQSNITIEVIDEIDSQLEELIKLRTPAISYSSTELALEIKKELNNVSKKEYGFWVYYPWLNKLIHVLNEIEFIEVRTNRNQNKITKEEQAILKLKKIGVIGLSVGKAIAVTIAMERICGELVLADFDEIELSNLNRIQTGIQNLGVKKTIVVAREIAEIDPYFKVTCFHDGVTEENITDFLTKNGKLNICIEVSDGLYAKIFSREKARGFGIPVVMNSSDRGTTDIERFDLDSDLPILHGLIDHLDLSLVKKAKTNEEKVPYLLSMLGVDTSSEKLKASMLEIDESIKTWPQLASGVVFGGGICTDVCRRILLNQFSKSGRYFVDIEQYINDDVMDDISLSRIQKVKINLIPKTNLEDYAKVLKDANEKVFSDTNSKACELTMEEIKELVRYAIMAPSGGNSQPWKWLYKDRNLILFNDVNRCESILNYKNKASILSFGAASENLVLKAHKMGYEVELNKFPLGLENDLIATFKFYKDRTISKEEHLNDHLVKMIPNRITNRNLGKRTILESDTEKYFKNIVSSVKRAELKIFTAHNKIDEIKEILAEIDKLFLMNKVGHFHFANEIRWSKTEVEETRDGIDLETLDLTPTERAGLIVAKDWSVTKYLKKWSLGNGFGKLSKKAIDSASALGMITMPKLDADNFFEGGRAVQRLWLAATEKGIAFQPMSIHTFLFAKLEGNNFDDIEEIKLELRNQYDNLIKATNMRPNQKNVFFFRLSKVKRPQIKALRRNIQDVLMYE
jgi:nitroreductase